MSMIEPLITVVHDELISDIIGGIPVVTAPKLLLESGDSLLLEDGSFLLLE